MRSLVDPLAPPNSPDNMRSPSPPPNRSSAGSSASKAGRFGGPGITAPFVAGLPFCIAAAGGEDAMLPSS